MGENKNLKGVPALDWGTKNEATARKEYLKGAKEMHVSFKYRSTGLHVSVQYPHLGATPDGLVECECCGPGLIEIKCPFKYRQCKISDIVDKSFCVQPNEEDGKLKLSHNQELELPRLLAPDLPSNCSSLRDLYCSHSNCQTKIAPLTRNNWRASLVPAAAVIPAPIAYIKVVAVKKLVVGFRSGQAGPPRGEYWPAALPLGVPVYSLLQWAGNSGKKWCSDFKLSMSN